MSGISLIIFSAFTMNLALQCALGLKNTDVSGHCGKTSSLIRLLIIFASIVLSWFFFSKLLYSIFSGMLIYVLLFPISYIVYSGLEYLVFTYLIKKDINDESLINFPGGITAVAAFICVNIAGNFWEVLMLSFGFTAGILLVMLITREIKRRAELEAVPRFMRGMPLVLVTMGMLSLIFTAGSLLILRMISTR